jgi:hypothetical protein
MWEDVYSEDFDIMQRMRVEDGWLYRNRFVVGGSAHSGYVWAMSMAFVPADPAAPLNTAVPYASQAGDTLSCTVGEWIGTPTAYAYQWQLDGVDVATDPTVVITAGDVGESYTCIVTATNATGSTAAPPSNAVVVTAP